MKINALYIRHVNQYLKSAVTSLSAVPLRLRLLLGHLQAILGKVVFIISRNIENKKADLTIPDSSSKNGSNATFICDMDL